MRCWNCGRDIDEAKFCPFCGEKQTANQTEDEEGAAASFENESDVSENPPMQDVTDTQSEQNRQDQIRYSEFQEEPQEESGIGIAALICAFLIPILGLVLGIVGTAQHDGKKHGFAKTAIIVSIAMIIVNIAVLANASKEMNAFGEWGEEYADEESDSEIVNGDDWISQIDPDSFISEYDNL